MPTRKFNVVVIGEETRLACRILPSQALTTKVATPFIVHEQGTPSKASSSMHFNHFISTNGDKLEACLRVTECPIETSTAIAREGYLRSTLLECLGQADLVLVSVPYDDRGDYSDTRLYTILS